MKKKDITYLVDQVQKLPQKPGCYLFKNFDEKNNREVILYIGKSKNLQKRVGSYFSKYLNSSFDSPKTKVLISKVRKIDFLLTKDEDEALVLENNLIKKNLPKYNIRLKDDKTYPYIEIDLSEPFPRPIYTRKPKRKKECLLFGPFSNAYEISKILKNLKKFFELRDCTVRELLRRKKPCLLYEIKDCSAPCVDKINSQDYLKNLNFFTNFFTNKSSKTLDLIEEKMIKASHSERFESAIKYRDLQRDLKIFLSKFSDNNFKVVNRNFDFITFIEDQNQIDLSISMIRGGLRMGNKNFTIKKVGDRENYLLEITIQYYLNLKDELPRIVYIDREDIVSYRPILKKLISQKLEIKKPPPHLKKYKIEQLNYLIQRKAFNNLNNKKHSIALQKIKELLNLTKRPEVLECYDIAIWQGDSPCASKVYYQYGESLKENKKKYRYYHLEKVKEINNDFQMMEQTSLRRISSSDKLPDIFIVDGGIGQIRSFKKKSCYQED